MKLSMIGTGYVGLVTGACFADTGNQVICCDINEKIIQNLKGNQLHIYEPSLTEMVERNQEAKRLEFTHDVTDAVQRSEIIFICVGTPSDERGHVDLRYIFDAARMIASGIKDKTIVVTKSTVPMGTTEKVQQIIHAELKKQNRTVEFYVANNPEFLKEGAAVEDFLKPDRIIVGCDNDFVYSQLKRLYDPFQRTGDKLIRMDCRSSELTKYAANAMLATRISFMNEVANLCEKVGANADLVRRGMGSDPRIGKYFLFPGVGYGGSCFPKDVRGLLHTAEEYGLSMQIITSTDEVNEKQKQILAERVLEYLGTDLSDKTIAIWGLSFKPRTDDMREAPSITVINRLKKAGATVHVHDPIATDKAREQLGDEQITYFEDKYECIKNANALCLLTEWLEYRSPDFYHIHKLMKQPYLFDGRNQWDVPEIHELGFSYWAIGKSMQ